MGTRLEATFRWTGAEDKIIRRVYPVGGIDACYPRLTKYKRTGGAIYNRARKLGLCKTRQAALDTSKEAHNVATKEG